MTIERQCLDAETVAAWLDGGLDAPAVAAAEAHASTCERCQALLATVAKTMPVQARPEPAGARLWKWWLAPLAATAAAVTIWMVVPQTPMQPPAARAPVSDAPAPPEGTPTPAPARDALAAQPSVAPPAPSSFEDSQPSARAGANETKAVAADQQQDTRLAAAGTRADQQAEPARRAETAPAETRQAAEASAERLREPAPAAPSAPAVAQFQKQTAPLEIVSPDPGSRWRSPTQGSVERSEDGGRTWIPVRTAANEEVTAGASPAPLVCWLVGRNGLVLLATDGTNFTRLPFAETVDLVSVTSPEPRIADVTAADGRTFRTEDGGKTWRNR